MALLEKWKELDLFRKILLAVLAAMIVGFGIATPIVSSRRGFEYGDALLYPREEGGVLRYAGRLDRKRAEFAVSPGGTVEYRWGDYTYGPYQVTEDPTASPKGDYVYQNLTGFEIRRGDEVLFRGGYRETSNGVDRLITEEGEYLFHWMLIGHTTSSGEEHWLDSDGRELSEYEYREPSLGTLISLVQGPELTHRGSFGLYLLVTLLAAFNIFQICCPGFMFRLSLWGRVRDPEAAEPSEFYLMMEHLEWIILTAVAAGFYWMVLTTIF